MEKKPVSRNLKKIKNGIRVNAYSRQIISVLSLYQIVINKFVKQHGIQRRRGFHTKKI